MRNFKNSYIWIVLGIMVILPLLYMDDGPKEHPELNRAIRVVRYMSAESQLERTAFRPVYPEGNPEQFVKWMFSTLGSAVWPPVEGGLEFGREEQKMIQKTGIPLLPAGVSLVPEKPDVEKGKQVVVSGDDERQMLVVEGYLDAQDAPALIKEWRFPLGRTQ